MWSFYDFVDDDGRNVIHEWLIAAPVRVKASLNARLDLLAGLKPGEWRRPYVDNIDGYDDIREIRFEVGNVQYRPLFGFGPQRMDATLLIGATKRGRIFDPRNAPQLAAGRFPLIQEKDHVCLHDES